MQIAPDIGTVFASYSSGYGMNETQTAARRAAPAICRNEKARARLRRKEKKA
jgi:hypothetical protein